MATRGETTTKLLSRMRAGDRFAFDGYFERHSARVLVYINYNMGDRLRRKIDPADILQNLYLKIYKNFDAFCTRIEEQGSHRVLIRMADHAITEAYRHHFKVAGRDARRERTAAFLKSESGNTMGLVDWVPSDATSITARVTRDEEYRRVMSMLQHLSPLEQYVTVARVIEGVPAQEIGERLGKTRGAIQMIVARARDKLRDRLGSDDTSVKGAKKANARPKRGKR